MKLTTKGRYAVSALIELAASEAPVSLQAIAQKCDISLNYLEQIFIKLKNKNIVTAVKGPGGGYCLKAKDLKIVDIIDAVEENTIMTVCSAKSWCLPSKRQTKCNTHDLWDGLSLQIRSYLSNISVQDVINNNIDYPR